MEITNMMQQTIHLDHHIKKLERAWVILVEKLGKHDFKLV